jgi:hypothetical protein
MIVGIFVLLLFLLFTGILVTTFTMILHGGWSAGAFVRARFPYYGLKVLLFCYPIFLWLIVSLLAEWVSVPALYSVCFYYANLILTIIAIEVAFVFRSESWVYKIALFINLLNGAFISMLLLVYHFNID